MKVVKRTSVYETNSSSAHSFVIGETVGTVNPYELNAVIYIGIGQYGYEWIHYNSVIDKIDYLAIGAMGDEGLKVRLATFLNKYFPNVEFIYSDKGYIDHESYDELWAILETDELLTNFILSPESNIFTAGGG